MEGAAGDDWATAIASGSETDGSIVLNCRISCIQSPGVGRLAQYRFNSLHDRHFEILFIVAIIFHLTDIVLQGV
jgi:hypothetical protein